MSGQTFIDKVRGLGLPLDECIVIGSGILDQLGLRQAADIDLVVSEELHSQLGAVFQGWTAKERDGQIFFIDNANSAELWLDWPLEDRRWGFDELIEHSTVIEGVRFVSLDFVKRWKIWRGLPKDIEDVALIKEFEGRRSE